MPTPKDEEIKVRVPGVLKAAIRALAERRLTSESEIAREALLDYLRARNIDPAALQENAPLYNVSSEKTVDRAAEAGEKIGAALLASAKSKPTPPAESHPVTYPTPRRSKKRPPSTPSST
jgi:hypothetical protein